MLEKFEKFVLFGLIFVCLTENDVLNKFFSIVLSVLPVNTHGNDEDDGTYKKLIYCGNFC